MLNTTVSVFDQDISSLSNLRSRLEALGYPVLPITQSLDEAVEQITLQQPRVIFVNTPPGMGDNTLNIVGSLAVLDIPMILAVNEMDRNSLENETQPFQFDWISKPIIDPELQATIKLALYRHKANKKVLDQQQQIKAIAHSTGEGFISFDINSKIGFMNMIAEMMTGWDQDEAFGKNLKEVFTIFDNTTQNLIDISELITTHAETGPLTKFSITLLSRDGNRIPVRARISPIRDQFGNMYGGVISFGNISELQQAVHEARLHNQRAEALLGITAKLNSKLDLDNVLHSLLEETTTIMETEASLVILFDEGIETYQVVATYSINGELHKYKGEEFQLAQHEIFDLTDRKQSVRVFSDKNDTALQPYCDLLVDEEISTLALAPLQSDNHPLGVMLILSMEDPKSYSEDDLHFLKGLADQASLAITNARLFQNVNHSRFRLQILSKRLVEIQEAERRSLARELHDQIGQMLTGLQFTLESGKRNSSSEEQHIFEESQEIISDLIKQVRDLSLRLLPSMLEDIGLLPTLQWHFDQFTKQTDIVVDFSHNGLRDKRFSPTLEITAYRIIQEGLTNVARYAQVKRVDVSISIEDAEIRLDVSDQGIGFDPERTISTRQSFGLIGMRERVLQIGGDLKVNSAPGKGTQLEAHLPLNDHVERRKYAR